MMNMSQKKFAQSLGISPPRLHNYLSGIRDIPQDIIVKIVELTGCEYQWLLTGEGEMFNNVRARDGALSQLIRLPVVGDISAGFPTEVVQYKPTEFIEVSASLLDQPPPYYVFKVDGESMLPVIHPGDYVIISNGAIGFKNNQLNGRICAFRTADGITLKQLVLDPRTRTTWLWPINSSFNPIPFTKDTPDFTLIGVLVLSIRKYT
jgi:SOS-response transcriptional repressor LexA